METMTNRDREDLITAIEDIFSRIDDDALFSETEVALFLVLFVLKGHTLAEAQAALTDSLKEAGEVSDDDHYSGRA